MEFDKITALLQLVYNEDQEFDENAWKHMKDFELVFSAVVQTARDAIFFVDDAGIICSWNHGAEVMLGYTEDEIVGKHISIIFPKHLKESHFSDLKDHYDTDKVIEVPRLRKDGTEIYVELKEAVWKLGEKVFRTRILRDITERKKLEQRLMESDRLFRLISEHAHEVIFFCSIHELYQYISPSITTLLGYQPEELVGQSIYNVTHPDDDPVIRKKVKKILSGESVDRFYRRVYHKNGTYFWMETTLKPIRNEQGELQLLLGISRDVTEQKNAEEDLRKSRSNLAYAQKIANLGHWERDLKSGETYWSDEVYRICGIAQGNINLRNTSILEQIVPVEDAILLKKALEQLHKGIEYDLEHRIIRPCGSIRTIHSIGNCECDQNGKVIRLFGTIQDVTEQKQTDELLRRTEKLFSVGQLAAGLAHEIRNPLTALKGFVQLLRAKYEEEEDKFQDYFTIMLNEIGRIESITGELLVLAKPQVYNYRAFDIREVLSSVIYLLETQAIMRNVQILFLKDQEIATIYGDENQIRQVFVNIIKNAIEAMPNGGLLAVELFTQDMQVKIQFKDSGKGIPDDILRRLGEPFYTTKEKGTGLGIMVSQKIIADHKGFLEFESSLGIGTTVTVTLPIAS